jgi:hypothetical protein
LSRGISSQLVFASYRLHAIRASLLALYSDVISKRPRTHAIDERDRTVFYESAFRSGAGRTCA